MKAFKPVKEALIHLTKPYGMKAVGILLLLQSIGAIFQYYSQRLAFAFPGSTGAWVTIGGSALIFALLLAAVRGTFLVLDEREFKLEHYYSDLVGEGGRFALTSAVTGITVIGAVWILMYVNVLVSLLLFSQPASAYQMSAGLLGNLSFAGKAMFSVLVLGIVVSGVYLFSILSLALPMAADGRYGVAGSLSKSVERTRGYRKHMFPGLLTVLGVYLVSVFLNLWFPLGNTPEGAVLSAFLGIIYLIFGLSVITEFDREIPAA